MASSTPTTVVVVEPEPAIILALSKRLDQLMRMMEEGLARMNRAPQQATPATSSSASTTSTASPTPVITIDAVVTSPNASARSAGAGTRAAGTASFFPAEDATYDTMPLLPADTDSVPASGVGAGESAGPDTVALLPARKSWLLDARFRSSASMAPTTSPAYSTHTAAQTMLPMNMAGVFSSPQQALPATPASASTTSAASTKLQPYSTATATSTTSSTSTPSASSCSARDKTCQRRAYHVLDVGPQRRPRYSRVC